MTNNNTSGTAMWMKTMSVKKRPLSVESWMKFRAIGSPNKGRASSHWDVARATYCASLSHTTQ